MCVHLSLIVFIYLFIFFIFYFLFFFFFFCVSLVFGDPLNSDLVRSLGIRQGPRCLLLIFVFAVFLSCFVSVFYHICTWTMNKSNQIKSNHTLNEIMKYHNITIKMLSCHILMNLARNSKHKMIEWLFRFIHDKFTLYLISRDLHSKQS